MNGKDKNQNIVLDQLRWLIDQKIEYLKSFESRIVQIIGVNGIFLALIWASLSGEINQLLTIVEFILIYVYFLSIAIQVVFLIIIGRPKQAEKQLKLKKSYPEIISNMEEYLSFLTIALERRAKRSLWIYRIFIAQFCLILFLIFSLVMKI